jgi:hypothetical protein
MKRVHTDDSDNRIGMRFSNSAIVTGLANKMKNCLTQIDADRLQVHGTLPRLPHNRQGLRRPTIPLATILAAATLHHCGG